METIKKHLEPMLATVTGGVTTTGALDQIDHILSISIGVATLLWWVRLWLKNPNLKPPGTDEKK